MQLVNFLLNNLLDVHIASLVLFHCWPRNETLQMVKHFHNSYHKQLIYHQFVHFKSVENFENLEERFLEHLQPTLAIYVDMKCEKSKILLTMANENQLYNQHYHWLLHDIENSSNFYSFVAPFQLSIDADISYIREVAIDNSSTLSYKLYDVYNNGQHIGGKLNMTAAYQIDCNRRVCNGKQYLSSLHLRTKYGNREQLNDVTLRVSTVVTQRPTNWPAEWLLRFLSQENETHIDGIARFGFQLSLILKDLLKCNMDFNFVDRWSISDTIGGSVGAVVDKTADLGSAPCLATEGRLQYLSAIIETGYFRSVCMFRTPHNAGIRGDVFLQPFSRLVWYIFAAILSTIALLLWLIFYLECKRMPRFWNLEYAPSLLNTFLVSFGAACIQSSALIPQSTGGRLVYLVLFLISFIMYNYYTSVVVSSLLSSPIKSKIKTLEDLAESSLQVGLEPLSFTKSYLNYSNRPEVHTFKKRKIESQSKNSHLWLPAEQGVLKVRDNPGYVYVFESSSGYAYVEKYYTAQQICDLNEVLFRPEQLLYTCLHRNSTYKELIRLRFLRILETGIYRKQRNYWAHMKLHCFAQNFVINVGMEYVAPLFFMLLCAILLAIVVLLLELAWQHYRHTNGNKNNPPPP
ncbi:uncharacterized protein Dwil_GK10445 [Drosophila willistoni]|uniref:Ionotropic receptor 75a n=1 Tax=Drosophila willistoni TaxID=7260 RepID=B4N4N1_DROWI|nr:uncharacterized protein Dwil_GK10445 [Drosophila willistoni]